jgi:hypothetical protein
MQGPPGDGSMMKTLNKQAKNTLNKQTNGPTLAVSLTKQLYYKRCTAAVKAGRRLTCPPDSEQKGGGGRDEAAPPKAFSAEPLGELP